MTDASEILILDEPAIARALTRLAHEITERNPGNQGVVLIGIQRGGVRLAERLSQLLTGIWDQPVAVGSLDINMHRDDLHTQLAPEVHETRIPFDITDKTVVLVDDVLFSGRTVRAADRGHRELPIKPDFVGKNIPTSLQERVHVSLREENGSDRVSLIRA